MEWNQRNPLLRCSNYERTSLATNHDQLPWVSINGNPVETPTCPVRRIHLVNANHKMQVDKRAKFGVINILELGFGTTSAWREKSVASSCKSPIFHCTVCWDGVLATKATTKTNESKWILMNTTDRTFASVSRKDAMRTQASNSFFFFKVFTNHCPNRWFLKKTGGVKRILHYPPLSEAALPL